MGWCCCSGRSKKDRLRGTIVTNSPNNSGGSEREALKNRESTYSTTYSIRNPEDNRISTQPDSNDADALPTYNWYFGYISRTQAHDLLRHEMDGTFLVRHSTDSKPEYPYIISVKHKPPDGISDKENYHYRIRRDENGYFTLGWNLYFKTVKDLLEYYKD